MLVVQVVSTVDGWLEVARVADADARVMAWREDYEARYRSVFEVYHRSWGSADRRVEAARSAPERVEAIRGAQARASDVLRTAERDLHAHGLLGGEEVHVVLMVGSGSSNGWVADHGGRPTLFLALEYLGDPPYDGLLILHELTHIAQHQVSPDTRAAEYPSSLGLLVEGSAVATTRLLQPGFSDSAYLCMDNDHEEWVSRCKDSAAHIAGLVLDHLDTPDADEAVASLFRNREGSRVPARAGYWAGDQIARAVLEKDRDLPTLLSTGAPESRRLAASWAERFR